MVGPAAFELGRTLAPLDTIDLLLGGAAHGRGPQPLRHRRRNAGRAARQPRSSCPGRRARGAGLLDAIGAARVVSALPAGEAGEPGDPPDGLGERQRRLPGGRAGIRAGSHARPHQGEDRVRPPAGSARHRAAAAGAGGDRGGRPAAPEPGAARRRGTGPRGGRGPRGPGRLPAAHRARSASRSSTRCNGRCGGRARCARG